MRNPPPLLAAASAVAALAAAASVSSIPVALARPSLYPEDHWSHSTRLTEANFESTVRSEIDAGRTLFVRWVASEG